MISVPCELSSFGNIPSVHGKYRTMAGGATDRVRSLFFLLLSNLEMSDLKVCGHNDGPASVSR